MTWHTAADKCQNNHSHLVHIKSREVTDFIHDLVLQRQLGDNVAVYIGKLYILTNGRMNKTGFRLYFLIRMRICVFVCFFFVVMNRSCLSRLGRHKHGRILAVERWYPCHIFQLVCRNIMYKYMHVKQYHCLGVFSIINNVMLITNTTVCCFLILRRELHHIMYNYYVAVCVL